MKKLLAVLLFLGFLGIAATTDTTALFNVLRGDPPFDALQEPNRVGGSNIYIVAKEDRMEIQSVTLNRGNCKIVNLFGRLGALPQTLSFGQRTSFVTVGCQVIEAVVRADGIDYPVHWKSN
jgi:hypothetical protein